MRKTTSFSAFWALGVTLILVAPTTTAQENMRIERERERIAKQQERDRFEAFELATVERDAVAIVVFAPDGTANVLDQKEATPDPLTVVAVRLGKTTLELGSESRQEAGWRARQARAAGVKAATKLQLELLAGTEGKPEKLVCSLAQPLPAAGGETRVFVLRGQLVDFHCLDRKSAG